MKTKKNNIMFFIFGSTFLFYQLFSFSENRIPYMQYIPLFAIVFLGMILGIIHEKTTFKESWLLIVPVILNYVIIPIVSFNLGNFNIVLEISDIILKLVFLFNIVVMVSLIEDYNDFQKMLKWSLLGNSILLIYTIIINVHELLDFTNYMVWFSNTRLSRADYGFYHPNTAALFMVVEVILLLFIYFFNKKKIIWVFIAILVITISSTGSRTALYSLIILLVSYVIIMFLVTQKAKVRLIGNYVGFLGILLFLKAFNWGIFFEQTSGRDYYLLHNLNYLINSKLLWFGLGPINNTNISTADSNILVTDNWYMTNLILYGVFGTVIFLFALGLLFNKLVKRIFSNTTTPILLLVGSFVIMICFYSFFETVLFVPGISLSLAFWVITLSLLKIDTKSI